MNKIKFNILFCCLCTLFFVSSSYGGVHKYKLSLAYGIFSYLFKNTDDDSQYICFVVKRSSEITLSELDDRYTSYAKKRSDIHEKYRKLMTDSDEEGKPLPTDEVSQHSEAIDELEKKYGLYPSRQSNTVGQSWPVKLRDEDRLESPYLGLNETKVSKNISEVTGSIESLIKKNMPEDSFINGRELEESEEVIEHLIKNEGEAISKIMKNIDLDKLGELGELDNSFELLSINADEGKDKVFDKFEKQGNFLISKSVMNHPR